MVEREYEQNQSLVIYAAVSESAYRGWHRYAAAHGCSVVALVEAMGRVSDTELSDTPEEEMSGVFLYVVQLAREITAERRKRKRDQPATPKDPE